MIKPGKLIKAISMEKKDDVADPDNDIELVGLGAKSGYLEFLFKAGVVWTSLLPPMMMLMKETPWPSDTLSSAAHAFTCFHTAEEDAGALAILDFDYKNLEKLVIGRVWTDLWTG